MKYRELTAEQVDAASDRAAPKVSSAIAEMIKEGHCDVAIMMYDFIARAVATSREIAITMGVDPQHYAYHFVATLANQLVQFNVDNCYDDTPQGIASGAAEMVGNFNAMVADQIATVLRGGLVPAPRSLNS